MPAASTIIIAREDFSIPGSPDTVKPAEDPTSRERHFFELLVNNEPDVVVLDLTKPQGHGFDAIRMLRERSAVPILIVHAEGDPHIREYGICGAADCIGAPVDIIKFNEVIQRITALTKSGGAKTSGMKPAIRFASMTFDPGQNTVTGANGTQTRLTTLENDVLSILASRPRSVCSRAEIAKTLYGSHQPTTDRAIDMIVNRLRKKLDQIDDVEGGKLIKTEFRRGYVLGSDVTAPSPR